MRADIALVRHDEEAIYGCAACGKGQGTSLGIDLVSRSSPCHTTRANNMKRELLKKANATRETCGSTTCSAASREPIITATAWCERASVSSQKKVTPRGLINQTMDLTGKSVQRTGRPYEKDSLRMSRFAGNGGPHLMHRICLTHERTCASYSVALPFNLRLRTSYISVIFGTYFVHISRGERECARRREEF